MRVIDLRDLRNYAHVVIAPHFDDAVLSAGGSIARWTAHRERVLVYTVCAGVPSPFSRSSMLARELSGMPSSADYVLLRRREDERALALLGADHYWDTALDAIDRHPRRYNSFDRLFVPPHATDTLTARAFAMLQLCAAHNPRATYYAPLAVGGHVDHQIAFRAARGIESSATVRYYEDFPYVRHRGALRARLRALRNELEQVDPSAIAVRPKIRAIAAYESQIGNLFGTLAAMERAVIAHAGRDRTERWYRSRSRKHR